MELASVISSDSEGISSEGSSEEDSNEATYKEDDDIYFDNMQSQIAPIIEENENGSGLSHTSYQESVSLDSNKNDEESKESTLSPN